MLSATKLPTPEEREAALALVPCGEDLHDLTGFVRGALMNRSVDLIDAALGEGHARAALVALQEGIDVLFQATIDVIESCLAEVVLTRLDIVAPVGHGEPLRPHERPRLPFTRRAVRDRGRGGE